MLHRWFGIFGIVGGEVGNLIAYGYAPAAIVTPIGAVGVLTNVLITTFILKEKLRKLNILGMLCVVCGIAVAVSFAPRSSDTDFSPDTYWFGFIATLHGLTYLIAFAISAFVMVIINRFYGHRSVVIPILTASIFGSLTILSAKVFSSLFTHAIGAGSPAYFQSPVPFLAFAIMIASCVVTMTFINAAMSRFGNCQVVPTYYALFTTLSVVSVGWVFREFDCFRQGRDAGLFFAGIVFAIGGVALVQVPRASRPARVSRTAVPRDHGDGGVATEGRDMGRCTQQPLHQLLQ